MPDAGTEKQHGVIDARSVGPVVQTNPVPPMLPPGSINGGANWNSGVIPSNGYCSIVAAATLAQAGTITIQRYLDIAGTIPIGAAVVTTLAAGVSGFASVSDAGFFQSFTVVVANTSGSAGALTGVGVLLSAASDPSSNGSAAVNPALPVGSGVTTVMPAGVTVLASLPAQRAAGSVWPLTVDQSQRLITQLGGVPQVFAMNAVTLSNTTETTLIAATASQRIGVFGLEISNPDTVAHTFIFRDSTAGTIRMKITVGPGTAAAPISANRVYDYGKWQSALNNNWTVALAEAVVTTNPTVYSDSYNVGA